MPFCNAKKDDVCITIRSPRGSEKQIGAKKIRHFLISIHSPREGRDVQAALQA